MAVLSAQPRPSIPRSSVSRVGSFFLAEMNRCSVTDYANFMPTVSSKRLWTNLHHRVLILRSVPLGTDII